VAPVDAEGAKARALRRHLQFAPLDEVRRLTGDRDPAIRLAAQIRVGEHLAKPGDVAAFPPGGDIATFYRSGLTLMVAEARIEAAASSARPESDRETLLAQLNELDFSGLDDELQTLALRDYHIVLARLGPPDDALATKTIARLDALYPAKYWQANHLLCELLVYFNAPSVVKKTLALLAKAERSEDFMEYLFFLRNVQANWTIEQRRAYFTALNHAETLEGARDYARSMRLIRAEYAATLTDSERQALGSLVDGTLTPPVQNTGPQVVVKAWTEADLLPRLERVSKGRSYEGGLMAFASAQCIVCHRFGKTGGLVGPDLTGVASRFSRKDILTSILEPSKVIDEKYRNTTFELKSGATVVGMVESEDDESVYVRVNPTSSATTGVPKSLIVKREASNISPMPPGLLNTLSEVQILDLLAFLESGGDAQHADFRK
jgi:putative heme-binding domain-containing protein